MKPTGIKNRREPITGTLLQPAKGQTCLRSAARSIRNAVERQLAKELGRRLTKKERKACRARAAQILAEYRAKKAAVQPPTPTESLIHKPGPLLVDPEGRAIA